MGEKYEKKDKRIQGAFFQGTEKKSGGESSFPCSYFIEFQDSQVLLVFVGSTKKTLKIPGRL